jgi:hypothetical protein
MSSVNKLKNTSALSLMSENAQEDSSLLIGCSGRNYPDTHDMEDGYSNHELYRQKIWTCHPIGCIRKNSLQK